MLVGFTKSGYKIVDPRCCVVPGGGYQAKERHILQKEALHFTATVVGIAAHLAPGDDDVHNKQKEREEHELQ